MSTTLDGATGPVPSSSPMVRVVVETAATIVAAAYLAHIVASLYL